MAGTRTSASGSSLFHHYQSLPHIVTGTLALGIGFGIGVSSDFPWCPGPDADRILIRRNNPP